MAVAFETDKLAITPLRVLILGATITCGYWLCRIVYLLHFHPIAKFPGPRLAAITNAWWASVFSTGRSIPALAELHRKYGDVVRLGPNELSFATPQSYQDIYGHVTKARPERFLKTEWYEDGGRPRITTVRDPAAHTAQRKALSHAFSAKALRDQEVLVQQYVNMFVSQLENLGQKGMEPVDVSEAYNWLTFDIIGDLAFGEPFNAVAEGKSHFWISLIADGMKHRQVIVMSREFPVLKLLLPFIVPKDLGEKYKAHLAMSQEKARRRMEKGADNGRELEDFFGHMIRKDSITEEDMVGQARALIVAGSETTANSLTATTYYLLRNPDCLARLQDEIRGAFKSADEITGDATIPLEYLHGVIEEGMRLFPPAAFAPPRCSPGATIDGHYVPAGVTVGNNTFVMARDPRYWREPLAFRPERWIGDGFGDQRKASQPFSTGPRGCLGINLAYMELRVSLAKVVFAFDMELASTELGSWDDECENYLLWKRPQVFVKFHPRKSGS